MDLFGILDIKDMVDNMYMVDNMDMVDNMEMVEPNLNFQFYYELHSCIILTAF